jgi:hypothetical protein
VHEVKEVPKFDGAAIDAELRALMPAEPGLAINLRDMV